LDAQVNAFFFFFSSRRRHTRSLRDWSSDVCSSDLSGLETAVESAVLAALSVAGLNTELFTFLGFPPARAKARKDWLERLRLLNEIGRASCRERVYISGLGG